MADAQGYSSPSSTLDSLSSVDDGTEVQYPNPERQECFHEKEQGDEGGEGEGEKEEEEEEEEDDDDDDDVIVIVIVSSEHEEDVEDKDEEDEDEEDEEEEGRLNSAAAKAENPFQVSNCPLMQYSRRAEIRRILRELKGEPDENQNKRCTRCKAMGHVCLECPLPILFIPRIRGYVPQQSPLQPNEAPSPAQGQETIPSKGGYAGSSSQEVDPETAVPPVSSASASQLGQRKSESGSGAGSLTRKL